MKHKAVVSWSGGKDSCYATILASQQGYKPVVLLNVLNEHGLISRSHGIPAAILDKQAIAMHLPICLVSSSWTSYEQKFMDALQSLKTEHKLDHGIFGDIDLQAHRDWEERVCSKVDLTAYLPLWQRDRKELVLEMLDAGMETMIVSCNRVMGERFLGKTLTKNLISELEDLGIDACGENGEYHTLVTNCSLFKRPLKVRATDNRKHEDYWFTTLEL